jgi:ferric-dicitrate binding protein FerR (iron transport regulator)
MDYSSINKYLAGQASEAEVKEIFRWIDSSPENRNEFIQYKKIWSLTSDAKENTHRAWVNLSAKLVKPRAKQYQVFSIAKVAASMILAFGIGILAQYLLSVSQKTEKVYLAETQIEVPLGQMSNITLPDGTTVRLNSGTKLFYSGNFHSGDRIVSLSGEAFFDVAKDNSHPFIVKTNSLDFKVYGTSFNIQAYPDDQKTNTTLVEGSLGLVDKAGRELYRLEPGENATFTGATKRIEVSKVNLDLYTSWKDGLVTFRNEKLKDVAKKIERWYNVEIVINNKRIGEEVYLGTIMKNKPIDQILEVFALTSSLKYRIVPRANQPTLIYWE